MTAYWKKITKSWCPISLCSPDRAMMIFTGLDWRSTGVWTNGAAGANDPQDGSALPFAPTGTQAAFLKATTLHTGVTVAGGPYTSITIDATAVPIVLTAGPDPEGGGMLPGGKINIGGDTQNVNVWSASGPVVTSTTGPTTIQISTSGASQVAWTPSADHAAGVDVTIQPNFPQQQLMAPGGPGAFDHNWNYAKTIPWYAKLAGCVTALFGKVFNQWPQIRGDTYTMKVGATRVFDRFLHFLDDSALGDQTDVTNNARVTGKLYSGVDHSKHSEANYLATTANPFSFNDQGTVKSITGTGGDAWLGAPTATIPIPVTLTISAATNSTTTITATVQDTSTLLLGAAINVAGATGTWASINGAWNVASVVDATHITFSVAVAPTGAYPANTATIQDGYIGTGGHALRISATAPNTAYLTDNYNSRVISWLAGLDGSGVAATQPFLLYITPRSDHKQWSPAKRHWNQIPASVAADQLTDLDHALSGTTHTTSLGWNALPGGVAVGDYVMIGNESCQITQIDNATDIANTGAAHAWGLTRDVFGDEIGAGGPFVTMPQQAGVLPTWPIATHVLRIPHDTTAGTYGLGSDDPAFNAAPAGTSPFWQALLNQDNSGSGSFGKKLTAAQCAQARRDRIVKAKCGMAMDELVHDIQKYCTDNFSNPTVVTLTSDNGWEYGGHAQAKGKITPYGLAAHVPIFVYCPTSAAAKYPYFTKKPNVVVIIADDDDSESMISGYPILTAAVNSWAAALPTEAANLAKIAGSGLDVPATVADLIGASPTINLDGESLMPYVTGAIAGSPRSFVHYGLHTASENGYPSFDGIAYLDFATGHELHYWKWYAYAPPSWNLGPGSGQTTAAQVPVGTTYTAWEELYDITGASSGSADPDEIANAMAGSGYTPANPAAAVDIAEFRSLLARYLAVQPTPAA